MKPVHALGTVAAGTVSFSGLYLGAMTVLAARPHACGVSTASRFAIVVPAHDEAPNIASTVSSLTALNYPSDRFSVVVVADNCTDDTADQARLAGAEVMERTNVELRGKGHALDWAFTALLDSTDVDAFVVVDADTLVDPDLLQHAAHHLEHGAEAIQVDYRVRNPGASWRTRLLDVAFTSQHRVRARGRSALSLSAGLRGNGMVFARTLLTRVPYRAFSVVEDIEYAIMLAEQGVAVENCDGTFVAGDMPQTSGDSESQRVRWELGRETMRRDHGLPLMRRAVSRRSALDADLAVDIVMPPMASIVSYLGVGTVAAVAATPLIGRWPLRILGAGWVGLLGHLVAGIAASPSSWRALPAMARVPGYVAWKVAVRGSDAWRDQASGGPTWVRTTRSESLRDDPVSDLSRTSDQSEQRVS